MSEGLSKEVPHLFLQHAIKHNQRQGGKEEYWPPCRC
nr:MAG TPA: hypothetical protein [Caudoviricetes sp.]